MVVSLGKLYPTIQQYAEDNYRSQTQSISNSEWYGTGASRLGLTGQIIPSDYNNAYQGFDQKGLTLRRQLLNRKSNPGRDITFSAPKSVSLLCLAKGTEGVIKIQHQAVKTTLDYAEKNCIYTRTGKDGKNYLQTNNAVIAIFSHDYNRNHDPQIHTHCAIFNLTQANDGKWRSMVNRQLYQQIMTLGSVYHHELGNSLQQLGYKLDWHPDGTFDVKGYSREQIQKFSSRRQEIIDAVGADASAKVKEKACIQTRFDKTYQNRFQQSLTENTWHDKVKSLGISHPQPLSHSINPARRFFGQLTSNFNQHLGSDPQNKIVQKAISILSDRTTTSTFLPHQLLRETLNLDRGINKLQDLQKIIENSPDLITTPSGQLTTQRLLQRQNQQPSLERIQANSHLNFDRIQIHEISDHDFKLDTLVQDFVNQDASKRQQSLILTDTLSSKQQLTTAIRYQLKTQDRLGSLPKKIVVLQPKNLDIFQPDRTNSYSIGDIIKFNRTSAKYNSNLYYRVESIDFKNETFKIRDNYNQLYSLKCDRYLNRQVFSARTIELCVGENMQFTRSHYQNQQLRRAGQSFSILDLRDDGQIKIQTQKKNLTVDPQQLFFSDYGYVDTIDRYHGCISHCFYAPSLDSLSTQIQTNLAIASALTKNDLRVYTSKAQSIELSLNPNHNSQQFKISEPESIDSIEFEPSRSISPPQREQEWNVLLAGKYLVEQRGELDSSTNDKVFHSSDGTQILRTENSLTISRNDAKLIFNSHNATVINTFDSNQIDQLIEFLSSQMIQHQQQQQLRLTQSHSRGLSIDL